MLSQSQISYRSDYKEATATDTGQDNGEAINQRPIAQSWSTRDRDIPQEARRL